MAILAKQTSLWIPLPAFKLVVEVIFYEKVVFCVKFGHLRAGLGVGGSIREFHQPLERHTNPFAAVVA